MPTSNTRKTVPPAQPDISVRLKEWRERLGLTQRQAAERLGVSERTFQQWEQGRQSPRGLALKTLQTEIAR
jgi:DNA-binding transcriptional regulator YiaG